MLKRQILTLCGLLASLALNAQTVTNVIDRFDPAGTGGNNYASGQIAKVWGNWFGGAFQSLSWDASSDANNNTNSGSMKIVANFPVTTDQFEVWNGISGISPTVNAMQFTNFQCDVRFAAGSATNSSGNFGSLQFGIPTPTYGQDYFNGGISISANNTNWVHVSIALNPGIDANLLNISGLLIHIWGAGLVGPSTLWVDNLQFVGMATNTGSVTINYTNTQQRIDGFGASSAWMFSALSTSDADLLFSTNTGAGLSLLRTRIAPGGVIDDAEGTIAQQATARGARVWSTPWTPPAALKITNSWGTNAPLNGGWFSNTVANCQTYASELAGYVAAMKNNYGISLYAVSVQNEPDMFVNYESCEWTSQAIHDFVTNFSAALIASNFTSTKIMLPEKSNWSWNLATNTMNDTITSNLVGILACHNYGSSASAVTQFGNPCPKTIWETEHYLGTDDSITNGLQLAQEIHSFMTVAQASAYHYWWLTGSGTGSIANNTANPAKRLFVMGNYSKFVRPNFYRIAATNTTTALVSAYKDTNSANYVIVAANPTAYPVNQTFVLTNFPVMGTLTQWVTSASLSLSNQGPVSVAGNTFSYLLPAWTVISFNFVQPVTNAPSIVQQPQSLASVTGGTASFTVVASGTGALFYQWYFNATNSLTGATNSSLTLTGLSTTNAGNYSVVVTNFVGSVTSTVATLTISTNASFVLSATDNLGGSSFNTPGNWTNSATGAAATFAPTNGYTYSTGPFTLRTPASVSNYAFVGDTLTVSAGGQINIKGGSGNIITFNNLLLNGTINDAINPNSIASIAGNMTVLGGALNVSGTSGDNRAITNSMNMSGSGALTNFGTGYVVYAGNNTAFTGPVVVTNTVLQVASQANLGGNPASFNPAQLLLDNGTLQPTASLALNNPNSGVTLGAGGGTMNVASGLALLVSNPVSGSGSLIKNGAGVLALSATNTFLGSLTISNGTMSLTAPAGASSIISNTPAIRILSGATFDVSGIADGFALGTNQTLLGFTGSSLRGNLTASGGATIAPGGNNYLQVMTAANNLGFLPGSTNAMDVNKQAATNDLLIVNGTLTFGGTLQIITNGSSALAAGDAFKLFSAGNFSGNFATVAGSAGAGLGYYFDPASGVLKVVSDVFNNPTNITATVAGGVMTISWPANHLGWILQCQTNSLNAGLGLTWFDLPGTATSTQTMINLDPANPSVFYRLRHP